MSGGKDGSRCTRTPRSGCKGTGRERAFACGGRVIIYLSLKITPRRQARQEARYLLDAVDGGGPAKDIVVAATVPFVIAKWRTHIADP